MQIKYLARKLGRKIKANTDIPHPIAMRMGKLIASSREYEIKNKFPAFAQEITNCACCGTNCFLGITKDSRFSPQLNLLDVR